ncbi:hypothetical protein MMAG44476_07246 [Mycolicibacterium mageritense DSM 44476 = CIP 104973]|uniref:Uncharacterized protein n=1 Tax=Mycolicibacterium mageritense TaxID=53462 RepID=A0AAI8TTI5_MYCME|nr:hypothetical protein [Mycolicibacterium mageritense]MBN3459641.1 hypothetical protein [Mycobacterium sp. DSM 3803]MCC9184040.1 hypothetical protein [Mycolicibacterium mageritense]TXI52512.1 MAG: hypothetical protein E6Q55_36840 [Mycolicibacterium mageritense]CDO21531.1 hypothetical protein BN978_01995 [Mycolicibacterium mageritense DSM 44476 = CIP 104973]BBX33095.1 hypothetical protein MMAGJ_23770 [Mycolicibacterium mageritense]
MEVRPVRSSGGDIQVLTTERGLPIRLKLSQRALAQAPQDLAQELLTLCQLSAKRAQVAHRRELAQRGFSSELVRNFNLATEDELAAAEAAFRGDDDEDGPPDTWMRSV